jgi:2-hydroxychromene-2-carboxylate isomerase
VERAEAVLGEAPVFVPVLVGGLFRLARRSSWAVGDPAVREAGILTIESRAAAYGLPAIRWPRPWPGDYLIAMRIATWADRLGAGPDYAFAAGRRAFLAGRDLSLIEQASAAAAEVGLDVREAAAAAHDPAIKASLRSATEAAFARGVFGVPTLAIGAELFWGDDRLDDAAAALRRPRPVATVPSPAAH